MKTSDEPCLAATVALLRDHADGPQVFMLKRQRGNAFTEGAYVFVGGRVDRQDQDARLHAFCEGFAAHDAARVLGLDPAQAWSIYVAALRETFEESAVLVGQPRTTRPTTDRLRALRDGLNAGRLSFLEVLRTLDFRLQPGQLRYQAHWVTPPQETRRFDTRFFVCRLPDGQAAAVDGSEALEARWLGLDAALQAQHDEQLKLAPPTYCVLEDLSGRADVTSMIERAPDRPVPAMRPQLVGDADCWTVLLPGDADYDPSGGRGARHRVVRVGGHWERQRS